MNDIKCDIKSNENKRLRILVIGCGGREYMMIKKFRESKHKPHLYCFGTYKNPGIMAMVESYMMLNSPNNSPNNSINEIVEFAKDMNIDFAIVGSEDYLQKGIVNALDEANIYCIGPTRELARLETSKIYCRRLLQKYGMEQYNPKWKSWKPPGVSILTTSSNLSSLNDNETKTNETKTLEIKNKVATEASYQELKSRQFAVIETSVRNFMCELKGEFVIKADGLKGGKGVFVSGDHFETIEEGVELCRQLYNSKERFLIEEKLVGEEFSLFTFCDGGNYYAHCPLVKDYKRRSDNDKGPNTGGMGSISFQNGQMPFLTPHEVETLKQINEQVCERNMFNNEEEPYIGVLYGSYMKTTSNELKVIEFNVRLGDPEAINLLGLLQTDFCALCLDMLSCNLHRTNLRFSNENSKCVYVVPKTYPGSFLPINNDNINNIIELIGKNIDKTENNIVIAGVKMEFQNNELPGNELSNNELLSNELQNNELFEPIPISDMNEIVVDGGNQCNNQNDQNDQNDINIEVVPIEHSINKQPMNDMILQCTGSRLLALYAVGQKQICDLNNFLESHKQQIYDMGFYFRSDIGSGWLFGMNDSSETNDLKISLYSKAGVNIETKNKAIKSIHSYAKETHHEYVIDNEGGFGGLIRLPSLPRANFQNTKNDSWVIVNSTDSVGSKSLFVRKWWGLEKGMKSLGHDIVNHCVNDILVQSPYVRPWTFMDYYATHHLDPRELRAFVEGVSEACKKVQCALIGGETAEIPGLYREGASDLVGAITGIVCESQLLRPRETICEGDLVFGLPSESPHTNGYTLIQKLINDVENDIQTNDKKNDKRNDKNNEKNKEKNKSMYLRYVDEWCKPHKCYMEEVKMLVENGIEIKGLCHITGGGFKDNPPRIIDTERYEFKFDYDVIVNEMPPWMKYLYDAVLEGGSTANEVFQTFNCGYGMLVVVDVKYRDKLSKIFCEKKQGKFIGEIVAKSSEDNLYDL